MIYSLGPALAFADLSLSPLFHLGGALMVTPIITLLAASVGWWRLWLMALAAWGLISAFMPPSPTLGILLFLSPLLYLFFRRTIDLANIWLSSLVATLATLVFFLILTWLANQPPTSDIIGSTLLALPLIVAWYTWCRWRRER